MFHLNLTYLGLHREGHKKNDTIMQVGKYKIQLKSAITKGEKLVNIGMHPVGGSIQTKFYPNTSNFVNRR